MTEDSKKPIPSKRKIWTDRGLNILSHFMTFYVIAIPAFYALILLGMIDSLSNIPDYKSPLLEPTFEIGLYFVLIASVVGIFSQISIELRFKKLDKKLQNIQNDLYEKKTDEPLQKIHKISKGPILFWNYFPFSWLKDFINWLPNRTIVTEERTKGYLLLIVAIVAIIQILGMSLAENTAPRAHNYLYSSIDDPNFKSKNIIINYNVTNIDNTRFDLMQPTERLYGTFTITNQNSTDLVIEYNERSFVGSTLIGTASIDEQKIMANKTIEFSRVLYLKDSGVNSFYFDFTIHNATYSKFGFLGDDSIVGKETIPSSFRVFSSDDYNSRTNQYLVYLFLGPVSLPLILIGMRSFKEIIEDKNNNSDNK